MAKEKVTAGAPGVPTAKPTGRKALRLLPDYRPGSCPGDYEQPIGISLAVPEEGYTVRQILDRHQAGMSLDSISRKESYDSAVDFDSEDLEKLRDGDLVEQLEALEEFTARAQVMKDELEKADKARQDSAAQEAAEQEAIRQEYRQRKKAKRPGEDVPPREDEPDS